MNELQLLDKRQIRQSFSKASSRYDQVASLQKRVAEELFTRFPLPSTRDRVLDVGCGTGFSTQWLVQMLPEASILAMDIAVPMLVRNREKLIDPRIGYFCGDAEHLPVMADGIATIVSSLALQWCPLLAEVFAGFNRALRSRGELVFSTFGPSTLQELKAAWATVDDFSHVNDFPSLAAIRSHLTAGGFRIVQAQTLIYQYDYDNVMDLLRELKDTGAHNVTYGRNRQLTTRAQFERMQAAYARISGERVVATYEIFFIKAVKCCEIPVIS